MSAGLELATAAFSGLGVGFASAVVPLVNAEAAVGSASVAFAASWAFPIAVVVAVGQWAGKLVLFEAGRRVALGQNRFGRLARRGHSARPRPAWQQRLMGVLQRRRSGNAVVLLSAAVGLPPLAVVSVAAGAARTPRGDFAVTCLTGRLARFVVLAWMVTAAA